MTGIPESMRRAMRAQGLVDPDEVEALVAAKDPIPPDDVVVAEQQGDWRSQMPDEEKPELSEREREMIQPELLEDV